MQKIIPKLLPITPLELYLQRVNATYDSIRKSAMGYDYTPAQFGGIFGHKILDTEAVVLEVITYEIK